MIPFNRPQLVGREHDYIDEALASGKLSGNGEFARRCSRWLEQTMGARRALVTPSCTAALEMTGILAELTAGDEVIVPDFAFVSTANAFALLGAVPVFVDVDPGTLNLDPDAVADAVTDRTRAIVAIHYGGVACEMERLDEIARRHGLLLIEDAAHSVGSSYRDRPLGSLGAMATVSFHETKSPQCGEGGALLVNRPDLVVRSEVIQEKGTDRSRFFRGEVDKYTWQDLGSSYLLSEVAAAFLWGQLEHVGRVTEERRRIWQHYHETLEPLEEEGLLRRPVVPPGCVHSGHVYHILMPTADARDRMLDALRGRGVNAVFHYLPLSASPGGRRFGRLGGPVPVTEDVSSRLLRLPLWAGLSDAQLDTVSEAVASCARTVAATAYA